MRKVLLLICCIILFSLPAHSQVLAEEAEVKEDNSVQYQVDLGDGQGSILIFGDGDNTIYLPPDEKETPEQKIQPNEITEQDGTWRIVMTETDIMVDNIETRFSKIVLVLKSDGSWELVWFEQED